MTASNLPLADRYAAAKAAFDAADKALKALKLEVEAQGADFLAGVNCDLSVHLSQRPAVSEDLLFAKYGITLTELDTCKVEGKPFPVIKVKAKQPTA